MLHSRPRKTPSKPTSGACASADPGWHSVVNSARRAWREGDLRHTLEAMGADVVRSQRGFKLTAHVSRDDLKYPTQAADAFLSQGKKMIRYAIALKRQLRRSLQ